MATMGVSVYSDQCSRKRTRADVLMLSACQDYVETTLADVEFGGCVCSQSFAVFVSRQLRFISARHTQLRQDNVYTQFPVMRIGQTVTLKRIGNLYPIHRERLERTESSGNRQTYLLFRTGEVSHQRIYLIGWVQFLEG